MNIALVSGLIILILLVIMLIAGVPIAVALGISSVVAILPIMDLEVAVVTGAQRIFSGISMFSLLAIPFFILAGNIMNKGGIAVRLINLAKLITGRAPGALAQTNVIANMLFGAISGSGTAAASAMGSIIGPIRSADPSQQRYDHLLAGVRRHFSCRIVHGRLPARYPVGSGLHDRNLLLCQKARLPQ